MVLSSFYEVSRLLRKVETHSILKQFLIEWVMTFERQVMVYESGFMKANPRASPVRCKLGTDVSNTLVT